MKRKTFLKSMAIGGALVNVSGVWMFSQNNNSSEAIFLDSTLRMKLYGIDGNSGFKASAEPPIRELEFTDDELSYIAKFWVVVNENFNDRERKKLLEMNPDIRFFAYVRGRYLSSYKNEHIDVEKAGLRNELLMTPAGYLKTPIDESTKIFKISKYNGKNNFPILASTVSGNYSNPDEFKAKSKFVFFIRIEDELMRVEKFNPETGEITVTRGFDGSYSIAHNTGTVVTSPCFMGKETIKNKWDPENPFGAAVNKVGYVLDFNLTNYKGSIWQAEKVIKNMDKGWDGTRFDVMTMNPSLFNLADTYGKKQPIAWNFQTGAPYTEREWTKALERHFYIIKTYVFLKRNKYPYLKTNGIKPQSYLYHGGEEILKPDKVYPQSIDHYNSETGFMASGNNWRDYANMLHDASNKGYALTMGMVPAHHKNSEGYVSKEGNPNLGVLYAYSFFLLVYNHDNNKILINHAFSMPDNWWDWKNGKPGKGEIKANNIICPLLFLPLGKPLKSVEHYKDLDEFNVSGTGVYKREFENGIILLNPTGSSYGNTDMMDYDPDDISKGITFKIKLDEPYIEPDPNKPTIGKRVTEVTMLPKSGKILLKQPSFSQ
jgi:hypothetical protein